MKFVCDKCKTRYSIGDERVRGKILKIRCKNCANVIEVREGMEAPADAAPSGAEPRGRSTTGAPLASRTAAAPAKAPFALQEEWYVSIDGVQSGPLSLEDAQRWVAAKPHDAELHCWKEGFDDWLPVEKVSHFRAHRQKAPAPRKAPTVPPPIPPQPLFASTMAQIEKSGPTRTSDPKLPVAGGDAQTMKGVAAVPATAQKSNGTPRARRTSGQLAIAEAFRQDDPADSHTNVEAPMFGEEKATAAEPAAATRRSQQSKQAFDIGGSSVPMPSPSRPEASSPVPQTVKQALEDDDDLQIGEVSRVVKLADLAPKPKPIKAATQSNPAIVPRNTGSQPRIALNTTASQPKLSPEQLGMNVDSSLAVTAGPMPDESMVAQSFAQKHRRGMMALIGFSALLVLGVIGVVAFVVSRSNDEIGGGLGGMKQIDTSRPEDIVRRQLPPAPGQGSGSATVATRPKWTGTRPHTNHPLVPDEIEDPKGGSLKASEIEDMAAKQGEGTKRCYMRAQKGAIGFDIADVKKIAVTLSIGKDGIVKDVQLSSHGGDSFGQCLIARIKGWRFRESANGGTFKISLAFSNS